MSEHEIGETSATQENPDENAVSNDSATSSTAAPGPNTRSAAPTGIPLPLANSPGITSIPITIPNNAANNSNNVSVSVDGDAPPGATRIRLRIPGNSSSSASPRVIHLGRGTDGRMHLLNLGNGTVAHLPQSNTNEPPQQAVTNNQNAATASTAPTPTSEATNATTTTPASAPLINLQQLRNNPIRLRAPIGTTVGTNIHNRIRTAPLTPLEPQPVPDATTTNDHDNNDLARFKCEICFDFLKEPVGCPSESCSSRFCHVCLQRVAQEARRAGGQPPKCPTCRVEFTTLIRDARLAEEMLHHGPRIACRYQGCPQQSLPLSVIRAHEEKCDFVKVKCRYASFGCTWIGNRGQVPEHEANYCHLAKVRFLVDDFRKLKADHSRRLEMTEQQINGTIQMLQVYNQRSMREQFKSTTNVLDMILFCHILTCSTNRFFFQSKDQWQSFYRTNEGRAAVTNFLVLLPSVLVCFRVGLGGFRTMLHLYFDTAVPSATETAEWAQWEFLFADALIGCLLGILAGLLVLANFIDGKSSLLWEKYQMPMKMGKQPLICDVMAVSFFTLFVGILDLFGTSTKGFLLWIIVALATTFFPALVGTISIVATLNTIQRPNLDSLPSPLTQARSWEPILFGLRFCLIACYFGIFPCFDSALLGVLLQKSLQKVSNYLVLKSCFFEKMPNLMILAYFGAKAAVVVGIESTQFLDDGFTFESIPFLLSSIWWIGESLIAAIALHVANAFLHFSIRCGVGMGKKIAVQAETEGRPQRILVKEYNLLGLVGFGIWISLQALMLHFTPGTTTP